MADSVERPDGGGEMKLKRKRGKFSIVPSLMEKIGKDLGSTVAF